jgi:hypothetical protein
MADWIFQSNPKRYDVHAATAASRQDWWNTPRYRDRITLNDRVWLQVVGPDRPGIYYLATIMSLPYESADSEFGRWQTDIRFDYIIDPPLLRTELLGDSQIGAFRAFAGFQGTNAPIPLDVAARRRGAQALARRDRRVARSPADESEFETDRAIEAHNATVRKELRKSIAQLEPGAFEMFVVRVLTELGFDVQHTGRTNDRGVDAEAVLSLEGLTSVMTKVQAKRWSRPVPGRVVRELRGALGSTSAG